MQHLVTDHSVDGACVARTDRVLRVLTGGHRVSWMRCFRSCRGFVCMIFLRGSRLSMVKSADTVAGS